MRSPETEPTSTTPPDRHDGGWGEGCEPSPGRAIGEGRADAFRTLPGFQAYKLSARMRGEGRGVPGLGARTYRDLRHTGSRSTLGGGTGISGTRVPGFEAPRYRESGHGGTGTGGTNEPAATGISGTFLLLNCPNGLSFLASNSVFINLSNNLSTRVGRFLIRGEGTWPGTV